MLKSSVKFVVVVCRIHVCLVDWSVGWLVDWLTLIKKAVAEPLRPKRSVFLVSTFLYALLFLSSSFLHLSRDYLLLNTMTMTMEDELSTISSMYLWLKVSCLKLLWFL